MQFTLSLRNILRHKLRSAMTLLAISLGVAGLILAGGFVKDIYAQLGEALIHAQTGHIQVFRKGFQEQGVRQPERFLIGHPDQLQQTIQTLATAERASAKLSFSALLNNGRRDLPIIGEGLSIDTERGGGGDYLEITEGTDLAAGTPFGILVGEGVAKALGLSLGDSVTMLANTIEGSLNTLEFEVLGLFRSFSKDYDARAVRIPLPAAQELMGTESANTVVVYLHQTSDTNTALEEIRSLIDLGSLEARSWRELSDFYDKTVDLYDRQFGVLQTVMLFMILLSVANSVNLGALERMSEFGTTGALGYRRRQVFALILFENLILGLIGASAGLIIGVTVAATISAVGIPMPPPPMANVGYTAYIRLDFYNIFSAFIIGVAATTLASVFPALRISRTPIVDALRQGI